MQVRTYLELIDDIEALPLPPEYKRLVSREIRASAARNGVTAVQRRDRANFVAHLLDLGEEQSLICARVMALYGLSRAQAYAIINEVATVRKYAGKPDARRL